MFKKYMIKTVEVPVYIAKDGTEFKTEEECLKYEIDLSLKEELKLRKERLDKLEIKAARNKMPYCEAMCPDESDYHWYIIKTPSDMNDLNYVYRLNIEFIKPDIVCIDTNNYDDHSYYKLLSEMNTELKALYDSLGVKI